MSRLTSQLEMFSNVAQVVFYLLYLKRHLQSVSVCSNRNEWRNRIKLKSFLYFSRNYFFEIVSKNYVKSILLDNGNYWPGCVATGIIMGFGDYYIFVDSMFIAFNLRLYFLYFSLDSIKQSPSRSRIWLCSYTGDCYIGYYTRATK